MNVDKLIRSSKVFLKRNSSTILTCVGAVGVIATSVLAVKATPKALELLKEAKEEKEDKLTMLEIIQVAGPAYIPAIVTGAATITCIFGANILNKRQQASLMSAYALLDESYKKYQSKVKEIYGEDAEKRIREEIMKGEYVKKGEPIDEEKRLFFDFYSMQFFESTMENVLNAEQWFNRTLASNGYASLNEFYDALGLPRKEYGFKVGWSAETDMTFHGYSWIDFEHEKVELEGGLECVIISMSREPGTGFMDF